MYYIQDYPSQTEQNTQFISKGQNCENSEKNYLEIL